MKAVVIYNSKTGFTKQYAQWISAEVKCDCVSLEGVERISLKDYDTVVFGSWFHAGRIQKLSWLFEQLKKDMSKNYIVFAVGASPSDYPEVKTAMERNIPKNSVIKSFYLPGGLNYDKLGITARIMFKIYSTMLKRSKDSTPEQIKAGEMMSKSYDISDRKYIIPIVRCIFSFNSDNRS